VLVLLLIFADTPASSLVVKHTAHLAHQCVVHATGW